MIIPGPFGTGKTRVLAVATYNFIETAKKSNSIARVLLCCQQQVSADTFVESYFGKILTDKHKSWGVKLVRLTRNKYYLEDSALQRSSDVPFFEFKKHVDMSTKKFETTSSSHHIFDRSQYCGLAWTQFLHPYPTG